MECDLCAQVALHIIHFILLGFIAFMHLHVCVNADKFLEFLFQISLDIMPVAATQLGKRQISWAKETKLSLFQISELLRCAFA